MSDRYEAERMTPAPESVPVPREMRLDGASEHRWEATTPARVPGPSAPLTVGVAGDERRFTVRYLPRMTDRPIPEGSTLLNEEDEGEGVYVVTPID